MTISATENRIEHSGDGLTVAFAYPYRFLEDGDLDVYVRTSAGAETLQTITTHYSVSGAGGASGGAVTFVTAPSATETVVIVNNPSATQTTDYVSSDPFPAGSHENALDRAMLCIQALGDRVDRSVQLTAAAADPSNPITIDLSQVSRIVGINAAGDGLQYLEPIAAATSAIAISGTPSDGEGLLYDAASGVWAPGSVGLADGDYGDITVSGSGTAMSIDAGAIDYAALASALLTGDDTDLVTGTAGADGNFATWNADGDLVAAASPPILTSVLTTEGDILYRDASGPQRLAAGTAGQALVMNSGGTGPEWQSAGSASTHTSSEIAITAYAATTVSHGLGAIPDLYLFRLRCKTAQYNYSPGDEVVLFGMMSSEYGGSLYDETTSNYTFRWTQYSPYVADKSTGYFSYITAANWRLLITAVSL